MSFELGNFRVGMSRRFKEFIVYRVLFVVIACWNFLSVYKLQDYADDQEKAPGYEEIVIKLIFHYFSAFSKAYGFPRFDKTDAVIDEIHILCFGLCLINFF